MAEAERGSLNWIKSYLFPYIRGVEREKKIQNTQKNMLSKEKLFSWLDFMQDVRFSEKEGEMKKRIMSTSACEDVLIRMIRRIRVLHAISMLTPKGVTWKQAIQLMRNRNNEEKPLDNLDLRFALKKHPQWLGCGGTNSKNVSTKIPMDVKLSEGVTVYRDGEWSDHIELWPSAPDLYAYPGRIADASPLFLLKQEVRETIDGEEQVYDSLFTAYHEYFTMNADQEIEPHLTSGESIDATEKPDTVYSYAFDGFGAPETLNVRTLVTEEVDGVTVRSVQNIEQTVSIPQNSLHAQALDLTTFVANLEEANRDERDDWIDRTWLAARMSIEPHAKIKPPTNPSVKTIRPLVPQKTGAPLKMPNGHSRFRGTSILGWIDMISGLEETALGLLNDMDQEVRQKDKTKNMNCVEAAELKIDEWERNYDLPQAIQGKAIKYKEEPRYSTKRSSRKN